MRLYEIRCNKRCAEIPTKNQTLAIFLFNYLKSLFQVPNIIVDVRKDCYFHYLYGKEVSEVCLGNNELLPLAFYYLPGYLAYYSLNCPFQRTDTGIETQRTYDFGPEGILDFDSIRRQGGFAHFRRKHIVPGNMDFFVVGVGRHEQGFQAVHNSGADMGSVVGCRDK